MRHVSETFRKPPRNGERFRDVGNVVVEFRELGENDLSDSCDYCYYNFGDEDLCDGGRCVRFKYADMSPIFGYYVKIDKE